MAVHSAVWLPQGTHMSNPSKSFCLLFYLKKWPNRCGSVCHVCARCQVTEYQSQHSLTCTVLTFFRASLCLFVPVFSCPSCANLPKAPIDATMHIAHNKPHSILQHNQTSQGLLSAAEHFILSVWVEVWPRAVQDLCPQICWLHRNPGRPSETASRSSRRSQVP